MVAQKNGAIMDTFTIRDLRERTGDLAKQAESGRLAIITKHGKPLLLGVPFDETLLQEGIHFSLAIKLFQEGVITLSKASKIAKLSIEAFIEELGTLGISVADYESKEFYQELAIFD